MYLSENPKLAVALVAKGLVISEFAMGEHRFSAKLPHPQPHH